MCLEITQIAKYPETFFDASKTGQTEKSYIFQEIGFPEIYVRLFEFFQNLIALQVWYSSKFLRELFSRCQFSQVVVRPFEISEIRLLKINIFSVENCYCLKQSANLHLLLCKSFL